MGFAKPSSLPILKAPRGNPRGLCLWWKSRSFATLRTTHMPIVTVTRRMHFNAAHRVHNPALSDAENTELFGKCNNPNWHGHNYRLDISVKGEISSKTGYVIDLAKLKQIVNREVIDQ